jgi:hypothetical protein
MSLAFTFLYKKPCRILRKATYCVVSGCVIVSVYMYLSMHVCMYATVISGHVIVNL